MSADLASLFEDVDIFGGKRGGFTPGGVLLDQVGQMQRAGKPRRSGTDDQYVRFRASRGVESSDKPNTMRGVCGLSF